VTGSAWTLGHSTRPIGELVALLSGQAIVQLADVRTIPRSRHNPQFTQERLARSLEEAGIAYVHLPGLGGLRRPRPDSINVGWRNAGFRGYADYMQTPAFAESLAALLELADRRRTAIMCAEAVPWRCHRSLIADALTVRGLTVRHIMSATAAELHRLTPWASVDGTSVTYPDRQKGSSWPASGAR
jgi:uncharacterized protein (DUF488 family)